MWLVASAAKGDLVASSWAMRRELAMEVGGLVAWIEDGVGGRVIGDMDGELGGRFMMGRRTAWMARRLATWYLAA